MGVLLSVQKHEIPALKRRIALQLCLSFPSPYLISYLISHLLVMSCSGEEQTLTVGLGSVMAVGGARTVLWIRQQRRPLPVRHGHRHSGLGAAGQGLPEPGLKTDRTGDGGWRIYDGMTTRDNGVFSLVFT